MKSGQKRRRQRRWAPAVLADIEVAAMLHASAPQVKKELDKKYKDVADVPTLRTLQEIMQEMAPPDPSGPWRLATAGPDEARIVLPVLRWMVSLSKAREFRSGITEGFARWIVKVHRACPDVLPPVLLFYLARQYQLREISDLDSDDLDIFMAFTPWRGEEHHRQLTEALEAGSIPVRDQSELSVLLVLAKRWLTPSEQAAVTTLRPGATPALQDVLSEFERRQEKLDREDWARTRKET